MGLFSKAISLPSAAEALPGRSDAMPVPSHHFVNGNPLTGPFPDGFDQVLLGMGCFWGAERIFWQLDGVYTTAAGYAGGQTPNPTYEEVCSGGTGHTEVVLVVWDSSLLSLETLLTTFWESHDPTNIDRVCTPKVTRTLISRSKPSPLFRPNSAPPTIRRSQRNSQPENTFTTPNITTSNTWRKFRMAIAALAAPACAIKTSDFD